MVNPPFLCNFVLYFFRTRYGLTPGRIIVDFATVEKSLSYNKLFSTVTKILKVDYLPYKL